MTDDTEHTVMKSISDALGMSPLVVSETGDPTPSTELMTVDEPTELSKEDREAEEDFALARENTKVLMEKGQEALDGILRIAAGSEHPRAYEVASNLLKTVQDMNAGLLKLHEVRRQLVPVPEPEKKEAQQVTNNNVFVGSAAELLQLIMDKRKQSNVIEHDNSTE